MSPDFILFYFILCYSIYADGVKEKGVTVWNKTHREISSYGDGIYYRISSFDPRDSVFGVSTGACGYFCHIRRTISRWFCLRIRFIGISELSVRRKSRRHNFLPHKIFSSSRYFKLRLILMWQNLSRDVFVDCCFGGQIMSLQGA